MHLRQKRTSRARAVIDELAEAARRSDVPERAADAAARIATQVAQTSAEVGSQAGVRLSEAAHAVTDEGRTLLEERRKDRSSKKAARSTKAAKKGLKRRVRRGAVLTAVGAVTAYFLDPDNGQERRVAARRRTSRSAHVVGGGLDTAAHVAHRTAEVADPGPVESGPSVSPEPLASTTEVKTDPLLG